MKKCCDEDFCRRVKGNIGAWRLCKSSNKDGVRFEVCFCGYSLCNDGGGGGLHDLSNSLQGGGNGTEEASPVVRRAMASLLRSQGTAFGRNGGGGAKSGAGASLVSW